MKKKIILQVKNKKYDIEEFCKTFGVFSRKEILSNIIDKNSNDFYAKFYLVGEGAYGSSMRKSEVMQEIRNLELDAEVIQEIEQFKSLLKKCDLV